MAASKPAVKTRKRFYLRSPSEIKRYATPKFKRLFFSFALGVCRPRVRDANKTFTGRTTASPTADVTTKRRNRHEEKEGEEDRSRSPVRPRTRK